MVTLTIRLKDPETMEIETRHFFVLAEGPTNYGYVRERTENGERQVGRRLSPWGNMLKCACDKESLRAVIKTEQRRRLSAHKRRLRND